MTRHRSRWAGIALAAFAMILADCVGSVAPFVSVVGEAYAVVGRPATPGSVAGVARRTTRRIDSPLGHLCQHTAGGLCADIGQWRGRVAVRAHLLPALRWPLCRRLHRLTPSRHLTCRCRRWRC